MCGCMPRARSSAQRCRTLTVAGALPFSAPSPTESVVLPCPCPRCRTLNPEEADFFYVPTYQGCLMFPVIGWADMPYWNAPFDNLR